MRDDEVKRHIWRNTISNYVCVVVRLVMGLVMFRLMFQMLPREKFGYWGLLWSLFGYSLLLDFGFGFTALKRVAELSVHKDWPELSRVLSTIFFVYVGLGMLIILAGLFGSGWFIQAFQITPGNRVEFEKLLRLFLCGLGLAFPLGLFPEILRGQQRIALANYLLLGGMIANFVLGATALVLGFGLEVLLVIALASSLLPDLICGWLALRQLPEVKIHPKYFSRGMIAKTMSFSLFAYVITVSNILLTKTDNLVLGTALAVSAVALYLPGSKVAEMFYSMTQQLPESLSPAAAHFHASGDRPVLQEMLVNATRFNLMVATPLYCICALLMRGILQVLTGTAKLDPQTYWTAQILLLWIYMMVVTQSVSKRIFMMCGHERRLMALGVGEAALNLGLSLGLVLYFRQVWCVALGSLLATSFFGWLYLWPWSAREANLSGWRLARTVLTPTWLACLPLLCGALIVAMIPGDFQKNFIIFMAESAAAFAIAAWGVWKLGLTLQEREKMIAFTERRFSRRKVA